MSNTSVNPSTTVDGPPNLYDVEDTEDSVSYSESENSCSLYILCLANTGTTSHVFNTCQLFSDYILIHNTFVGGVGETKTRTHGWGTIRLTAEYGDQRRIITFQDTLHVPEWKHNLISLGRWETSQRSYQAKNGSLTLYNSNNSPVIEGERKTNNLYWFHFTALHPQRVQMLQESFHASTPTWETWHRRFGHISYHRLVLLWLWLLHFIS
jgi:hypothetical protein